MNQYGGELVDHAAYQTHSSLVSYLYLVHLRSKEALPEIGTDAKGSRPKDTERLLQSGATNGNARSK